MVKKLLLGTGILALIVAVLGFIPFAAFWAVETLFEYSINFNLRTGVAFWVLMLVINLAVGTE